MNPRNSVLCVCAGALLCAATVVSAQAIYKQVDPDGRVVYTDRPDTTLPGGAELVSPAPAAAPAVETPPAKAPVRRSQISPKRAAAIDAQEAERRLNQARLSRDQGATPQPGERSHGVAPSAVNDRYWRRQEQLRREVEASLRRVQETHQVLLAQR